MRRGSRQSTARHANDNARSPARTIDSGQVDGDDERRISSSYQRVLSMFAHRFRYPKTARFATTSMPSASRRLRDEMWEEQKGIR